MARRVWEVGSVQGDGVGKCMQGHGGQFSHYWRRELQAWETEMQVNPVVLRWSRRRLCGIHGGQYRWRSKKRCICVRVQIRACVSWLCSLRRCNKRSNCLAAVSTHSSQILKV